jgi:hypothetical protein
MAKKRKPRDDIRREDCHTEQQRLEYSEMMYRRWQSIPHDAPPSVLLDFERFPTPTEDWHHPEYHIMVAKAERERMRLLGRAKRRMLNGK